MRKPLPSPHYILLPLNLRQRSRDADETLLRLALLLALLGLHLGQHVARHQVGRALGDVLHLGQGGEVHDGAGDLLDGGRSEGGVDHLRDGVGDQGGGLDHRTDLGFFCCQVV